jgi:protein-S-isoprenylcysteine O-methyltransferase Ste14
LPEIPSLGARGGGWVVLQFALLAAIVGIGLLAPGWPDGARWWLNGAAVVLVAGGVLVIVQAARALGSGLTPFPKPAEEAELVEHGPYAVVRHPVYTGGILFAAGISLALSPWALLAAAALALVWALKAALEERFLLDRYPTYDEYRRSTRYRLFPFVY